MLYSKSATTFLLFLILSVANGRYLKGKPTTCPTLEPMPGSECSSAVYTADIECLYQELCYWVPVSNKVDTQCQRVCNSLAGCFCDQDMWICWAAEPGPYAFGSNVACKAHLEKLLPTV